MGVMSSEKYFKKGSRRVKVSEDFEDGNRGQSDATARRGSQAKECRGPI